MNALLFAFSIGVMLYVLVTLIRWDLEQRREDMEAEARAIRARLRKGEHHGS